MTTEPAVLRIVAGKGGVGRSTVTAALAADAAASGRRVLAIDALGTGGLGQLVASAGLSGFETLRLTTRASLDEYLKIYLRLPLGSSRLGPLAAIFDYVSAAAPGVRELLVIGKIGWEVRNGPWDEIVVDAPATGHVVELLTAPGSMAELIPTGPLADQTDWLSDVLAADTTTVTLVTLPEELPVTETGELHERIRTETATRIEHLIVNRMPAAVEAAGLDEAHRLAAASSPVGAVARLAAARFQAAEAQTDRLAALGPVLVPVEDRPDDPVGAVRAAIEDRSP